MKIRIIAVAGIALAALSAHAVVLESVLSIDKATSFGLRGAVQNDVRNVSVQSLFPGFQNFRLIGLGWNLRLIALTPSLLSDMQISLRRTDDSDSVELAPALSATVSGEATFASAGIVDLVPLGLDFELLPDNNLRLEFYEFFDDLTGQADGFYGPSALTFRFEAQPVPEPGALVVLALGSVALTRRRSA